MLKNVTKMWLLPMLILFLWGYRCHGQATVELKLRPDDSSRWIDLFSAAWVEIGQGRDGDPELDGFFLIEAESGPGNGNGGGAFDPATFDPATFDPIAYDPGATGAVNAFPHEPVFDPINYSVTWDDADVVGTGIETATILSFDLNFADDVAVDILGITSDSWATANPSGTVSLVDGQLVGINGGADVCVTYDFTPLGGGPFAFQGTFQTSGNTFALLVDDVTPGGFPIRIVWDLHGFILTPGGAGDVNGDGIVNLLDVAPFIAAVADGTYVAAADTNMDGTVDLLDIDPFVDLLSSSPRVRWTGCPMGMPGHWTRSGFFQIVTTRERSDENSKTWFYFGRTSGRHRDYRDPGGHAIARSSIGPRGGAAEQLCQQYAANFPGHHELRERSPGVSCRVGDL